MDRHRPAQEHFETGLPDPAPEPLPEQRVLHHPACGNHRPDTMFAGRQNRQFSHRADQRIVETPCDTCSIYAPGQIARSTVSQQPPGQRADG